MDNDEGSSASSKLCTSVDIKESLYDPESTKQASSDESAKNVSSDEDVEQLTQDENPPQSTNVFDNQISQDTLAGLNLLHKCLLANIQLNLASSDATYKTTGNSNDEPEESTSSKRTLRKRKKIPLYNDDIEHTFDPPKIKRVKNTYKKDKEQNLKCQDCEKEFKNKSDLRSHTISHSSLRPFKCEICESAFKSKNTLLSHLAIHATVKPFICDKCGEAFGSKEKLKQHSLRHITERSFKCAHCTASFKRKGDLQRHQDVHSPTRPFQCPDCGCAFKRKGSLKKHSLNHLDPETMKLLDDELQYHLS